MNGRGPLTRLSKEFPKLTEKERDALICVHPYLDALSQTDAAEHLGISRDTLRDRLERAFQRIPWLQKDMRVKREQMAKQRRSIRRPSRFGDMSMISNDGQHDTFHEEVILRKF
jgi:DNA-directed RNA polymerase specialized sigma24 family protein